MTHASGRSLASATVTNVQRRSWTRTNNGKAGNPLEVVCWPVVKPLDWYMTRIQDQTLANQHRTSVKVESRPVHCEQCNDRDYVAPSPEALALLRAGVESAKNEPVIYRRESFAQYADDE